MYKLSKDDPVVVFSKYELTLREFENKYDV